MAEKKITKREMFSLIKEQVKDNADMVAFIDHELELLAKKNASDKKPTANQVANEGIKGVILETLANADKALTITEIGKANADLADLANQKISALLRQLIADGKVERVEDKRKAYFKVVA